MIKRPSSDFIFLTIKNVFLIFLVVITLYPFLTTLALSLNDADDSVRGGIKLWPRIFTFQNYLKVFRQPRMGIAVFNTFSRVIAGVSSVLIMSSMAAYISSVKDFVLRKQFNFLYVFTMYVSGSIIPTYFLYKKLGLINNFNVYWIPWGVVPYYLFMIRAYIYGIPKDIIEYARIEGANDNVIYWRIILPLCKPVLSCIALFIIVDQWNMWFDTFLYAPQKNLTTLQYELQRLIAASKNKPKLGIRVLPTKVIEAAMGVILTVPMVTIYLIFQKYFVSGLIIGGIKG